MTYASKLLNAIYNELDLYIEKQVKDKNDYEQISFLKQFMKLEDQFMDVVYRFIEGGILSNRRFYKMLSKTDLPDFFAEIFERATKTARTRSKVELRFEPLFTENIDFALLFAEVDIENVANKFKEAKQLEKMGYRIELYQMDEKYYLLTVSYASDTILQTVGDYNTIKEKLELLIKQMPGKTTFTVKEVTLYLNVPSKTIQRYVKTGKLPKRYINGRLIFTKDELEQLKKLFSRLNEKIEYEYKKALGWC
ncbi:hypothetical protein SU69_07465 [Thermosipho melanesiensis]|uniref:Helix-turn-helix domain-containing protein n=2 Tax=Thermosipho melanesiensis TaxID=46541 RepID=A6LN15_THEM4|nr:helix-turn-helix domain-containing protein [Thermosipho melanesiensis]ABR31316.1 hypothetical protein Tmel_1469 [Thermosipho melanesiensis BI429]APT74916.1 hypothetical protein BW47_07810 [Thermosipho melanesiensis]OOC36339.1 hypothetical protein SU68_07535 [Thermosipho melanesiensis]OOC37157.1 hypothetical protein SU69_07465 [Thermosipho melanesiensis]OOC37909.1 hypothetical protein SU70_07475 [Thermosipho melanesiensis]